MSGSPHHRISEPKVILLAAGMVLIGVLCVVAIADTGAVWLVLVAALAIASVALAIIIDLRGIISDTGGDDATAATTAAAAAPDRAVVMCTASMTAEQVLEALETTEADKRSIMFVAPEGLGTGGLM
ncbi:MAG TPA: hypothetical protein VI300_17900, partial [Solirubrobacter sp.]